MRKNKQRFLLIALAFAALFLLFGCGEQGAHTETTDQSTATQLVSDSAEPPSVETDDSVLVPILMYHHFSDEPNDSTIVSPETFRKQLEFIKESGFTTVSFEELYAFVTHGTPLPAKPVCITIDDGYYSNYSIAFPILRELEMKATIFPVGWCIGKDEYKDTGNPIIPHFGFEEMREMLDSGLIFIGSHTYDMHQSRAYETAAARPNVLPLENESRENHVAALTADLEKYSALFKKETGLSFTVLAYPEGAYDSVTEETIHSFGIPITLSTSTSGHNYVTKGEPRSLHAMYRLNVTELTTEAELLSWLEGAN